MVELLADVAPTPVALGRPARDHLGMVEHLAFAHRIAEHCGRANAPPVGALGDLEGNDLLAVVRRARPGCASRRRRPRLFDRKSTRLNYRPSCSHRMTSPA